VLTTLPLFLLPSALCPLPPQLEDLLELEVHSEIAAVIIAHMELLLRYDTEGSV
jgi:hypothetical protein